MAHPGAVPAAGSEDDGGGLSPEERRTTTTAILVAGAAAVGGFLFGFDSAVVNGTVDAVQERFELGSLTTGFTVSVALLGSALGAWYAGQIADRIGRVKVMLIAAFVFAISAVGAGLAFTEWDLILWRFVGGVGIGTASVIAPAYIAEIAPAHLRGRLGSLQQLAIVLGIFSALLSDALLANLAGGAGEDLWLGLEAWRWMFIAGLLPALIYGVLALQIPESPRYLVAKGDMVNAAAVLKRVVGLQHPEGRVAAIRDSLRSEHRTKLSDLRGDRLGLLPIVWVGILLSAFQQLVGINVIFYYSTTLWKSVGFSEGDAFKASVITSIVNVVVTLAMIPLVDRLGRRPLLLAGSLGMTVTLAVLAFCFTQGEFVGDEVSLPDPYGTIALVAANLYVVAFGMSWGPVVWVLLGEMFPNWIRGVALSVAAAAQWIANFAISTSFPPLSQEVSLTFAYGLYTVFALLSFFFVLRNVPETKGVELEDMTGLTRGGGRKANR